MEAMEATECIKCGVLWNDGFGLCQHCADVLRAQLAVANEQGKNWKVQRDTFFRELEDTRKQLSAANERAEKAEAILATLKSNLPDFVEKTLTDQLAPAIAGIEIIERQIADKNTEIARLKSELDEAERVLREIARNGVLPRRDMARAFLNRKEIEKPPQPQCERCILVEGQ